MILTIPDVLSGEPLARAQALLNAAPWVDGKVTAGYQSGKVKSNLQIPEQDPAAQELGSIILRALENNPLFISAALPHRVFPPLFNQYSQGHFFGTHVDNAIRQVTGTPHRIRTDLSATLFFSTPEAYEGGELCIEDTYGVQSVKLPVGHMVLYPATSLHHVRPITKGTRTCSFFWIQSMIRSDAERTILFDLDTTIQILNQENPDSQQPVRLTGIYHNLIRKWAEL